MKPGEVKMSPANPNYCVWQEPDGPVWEFRYIVTQHPDEGPERLEMRIFDPGPELPWMNCANLSQEVQDKIPEEVLEFFHGPNITSQL